MAEPSDKPLIEYPTVYAYKVMGKRSEDFDAHVRRLFAGLLGAELPAEAVTENVSKQGNWVSLTVSVRLETEDQRQRIYASLHADERIVYYL
jgi:putative lipoic acid-binding regulatory protein